MDELTVIELMAVQVNERPESVAVRSRELEITYIELYRQANQLANYLGSMGVKKGSLVGICMERSLEEMVAILGVLKAGAAYVPLDPGYPQNRLALMFDGSQFEVLLTVEALTDSLSGRDVKTICVDAEKERISRQSADSPGVALCSRELLYVLFTSGSTGHPKGVAMEHGSLSNLITWQLENTQFLPGQNTLQFAPLSFDVSFQEIFSTWCSGGTLLVIPEEERRDPDRLWLFIEEMSVERLFLPFVALQQLASAADLMKSLPVSLREIITAGEQLQITPSIVRLFEKLPKCVLHNQYGPTETHVVTSFTLTGSPRTWPKLPPIGRPVTNTKILILDESLAKVPKGEAGEICVAGASLARGYLRNEDLTEQSFVTDPSGEMPAKRLYRTGDLGKFEPDGNLVFLGRKDDQVKIRGFRVEPGEVEIAIRAYAKVKEATVVDRVDSLGERRLVAYIVTHDGRSVISSDVRRFLEQALPEHMIPSVFVALDNIPTTPSGKVDRRALPVPGNDRPQLREAFVRPEGRVETTLAGVWRQLLEIGEIGVNDNFFDLGGTSLLSQRMVAELREKHGFKLTIERVFQYPTIASLANYLSEDGIRSPSLDSIHERANRQRAALASRRSLRRPQ